MNTQTSRTLRTVSFITICLPLGGIKPVCHDRHKTVPEFIVILCNQMWMTTTEVLLLMHSLPIKDVLTLGRLTFTSFFEKLILIGYISDRAK